MGEPRSLSGERGAQARAAAGFAARLRGRLDVPVELWDERLTTVEALRRGREGGSRADTRQPRGVRAAGGVPGEELVSTRAPRPRRPHAARAGAPSGRGARADARVARPDRGDGWWRWAWRWPRHLQRGRRGPRPPSDSMAAPADTLLIREGLRREDVAALLDKETTISGERYLALTAPGPRGRALARADRPTSLEGFLFPATYEIAADSTAADLVDRAGRGLRGQHGRDRLPLRAVAQPHQLRRADHRLDGRARGGRRARAADRGRRDLQPAQGSACASTSTRRCSTRSASGRGS